MLFRARCALHYLELLRPHAPTSSAPNERVVYGMASQVRRNCFVAKRIDVAHVFATLEADLKTLVRWWDTRARHAAASPPRAPPAASGDK